jgi:hypothetical protein
MPIFVTNGLFLINATTSVGFEDRQRRIDIPVSAGIELLSVAECPHIMNGDGV